MRLQCCAKAPALSTIQPAYCDDPPHLDEPQPARRRLKPGRIDLFHRLLVFCAIFANIVPLSSVVNVAAAHNHVIKLSSSSSSSLASRNAARAAFEDDARRRFEALQQRSGRSRYYYNDFYEAQFERQQYWRRRRQQYQQRKQQQQQQRHLHELYEQLNARRSGGGQGPVSYNDYHRQIEQRKRENEYLRRRYYGLATTTLTNTRTQARNNLNNALLMSLRAENERRLRAQLYRPPPTAETVITASRPSSTGNAEESSHKIRSSSRQMLPGRVRSIIPFGGLPSFPQTDANEPPPQPARSPPHRIVGQTSSTVGNDRFQLLASATSIASVISSAAAEHQQQQQRHPDEAAPESIRAIAAEVPVPTSAPSLTLSTPPLSSFDHQQQCPTTYGNSTCVFQHHCPQRRLIFSASSCTVQLPKFMALPGGVCCLLPSTSSSRNSDSRQSSNVVLFKDSPYFISVPSFSSSSSSSSSSVESIHRNNNNNDDRWYGGNRKIPKYLQKALRKRQREKYKVFTSTTSAPLPSPITVVEETQVIVEPAKYVNIAAVADDTRPPAAAGGGAVVAHAGAHVIKSEVQYRPMSSESYSIDVELPQQQLQILPLPPSQPPPPPPPLDNSPRAVRERKIEKAFLDINQCGRSPLYDKHNRSSNVALRTARIIGGVFTSYGQWPYFALLLNYRRPRCGGALINDEYMVTAAHCVAGDISNYDLTVDLGDYDLRTNNAREIELGELPSETFNVRKVFRHPAFQRPTLRNDIALIRLDRKVQFKPHIQPVCLPQREYWSVRGAVLGLGKRNENDANNRLPTHLMKVELPIIKRDTCRRYFRKYEIEDMIMDMHICAGGIRDQDACQGDSGGPISVQVDQHNELVGLVSFGWGCGQPNVPGVYSNMYHFRDWIIDTVLENMDQ